MPFSSLFLIFFPEDEQAVVRRHRIVLDHRQTATSGQCPDVLKITHSRLRSEASE